MGGFPSLSLFTGAGGLDIGLEAAGFCVRGAVEIDPHARKTIQTNRSNWTQLPKGDVLASRPEDILDQFSLRPGEIALVSGGPPCQPFSKASQWVSGEPPRFADKRSDALIALLELVQVALPETVIIENVAGLASKRSEALDLVASYFEQINLRNSTNYRPMVKILNAADFGVPQIRQRTFVIAIKSGAPFKFPAPVYSSASSCRNELYRTAWDAIGDLANDEHGDAMTGRWAPLLAAIPEGSNYQWLTRRGGGQALFGWRTKYWSFLLKLAKNKPSWTISASPGPSTGPFHWNNRKLSATEIARLQCFPETYVIHGPPLESRRQIGNAVPPPLAQAVGAAVVRAAFGVSAPTSLDNVPRKRNDCPPPEPVRGIPNEFLHLVGEHPAHPGPGCGPRAKRGTM